MDQFSLELFWRLLGGLAAGAIIGLDRNLHGKAAGIWLAAILGAASGAGYYAIVVMALVLGLLLLRLGGKLENRLHARFDGRLTKKLPPQHDDDADDMPPR
jgi:uncharacterized membrane protein YhiD involved in acid resistance